MEVKVFVLFWLVVGVLESNARQIFQAKGVGNVNNTNHRKGKAVIIYHEPSNCVGIFFLIRIWRCGTTTTTTTPPPPPDANLKKLERIIMAKIPFLFEKVAETLNEPKLKPVVSILAPKVAYPVAHFAAENLLKIIPEFIIDKLDDVNVPFEVMKPSGGMMMTSGTGNEHLKKFLELIIPNVFKIMASAIFPGFGFLISPATNALTSIAPDVIPNLAGFIAMQINEFVPYDVIKILEEVYP